LELSEPVAPRPVQLARPLTPVKNPLYASGYGYNPAMVLHQDKDQLMTTKVWVLPFGQCPEQHKAEDAICADENKLDQNVCKVCWCKRIHKRKILIDNWILSN
jgi:hypothetical protein